MNSPWGKVDSKEVLDRGIIWVGTPGHGGLGISKAKAEDLLSEEALDEGILYGGYYFFEEDCAWAVPCYESETISFFVRKGYGNPKTKEEFKEMVDRNIKEYFKEYLSKKDGTFTGLRKSEIREGLKIDNGMSMDTLNYGIYTICRPYKKDEWIVNKYNPLREKYSGPYRLSFASIRSYLNHGGKIL